MDPHVKDPVYHLLKVEIFYKSFSKDFTDMVIYQDDYYILKMTEVEEWS